MNRMHIHVAVDHLNDSIRFYSAMFGRVEPAVLKEDYCKWELTGRAVNFAISKWGAKPGVDDIGIQVETDAELEEMNARFAAAELPVQTQTGTTCCTPTSDKAWTVDSQGVRGKRSARLTAHRSMARHAAVRRNRPNRPIAAAQPQRPWSLSQE